MATPIYMNADTEIIWDKMTDEKDGTYINDATVTYTVSSTPYPTVTAVSNGTGSLSYVAASNGKYVGAVAHNASLTRDQTYYLQLTATSQNRYGFREIECVAGVQGAGISINSGLIIG